MTEGGIKRDVCVCVYSQAVRESAAKIQMPSFLKFEQKESKQVWPTMRGIDNIPSRVLFPAPG